MQGEDYANCRTVFSLHKASLTFSLPLLTNPVSDLEINLISMLIVSLYTMSHF